MAKLDRVNIAISNGSACGAGDIKPSPILCVMGIEDTHKSFYTKVQFLENQIPLNRSIIY